MAELVRGRSIEYSSRLGPPVLPAGASRALPVIALGGLVVAPVGALPSYNAAQEMTGGRRASNFMPTSSSST